MSATASIERQSYPLGVALYGGLLAVCLPLVVISVRATWVSVAREYRYACIVAAAALFVGAIGLVMISGGALRHQLRRSPRPPVGDTSLWRPTTLIRAGLVLTTGGVTTSILALESVKRASFGVGVWIPLLGLWLIGIRLFTGRLVANHEGIVCTNPLRTVRIPWKELVRLEARGESAFGQRIVAVTADGRERMLWVFDPRVPVAPGSARMIVEET